MKPILLALLRIYKIALSPYLGSQCRFAPTCSDYARDAVIHHGAARGSWMAACRLCRCHPSAQTLISPTTARHGYQTHHPLGHLLDGPRAALRQLATRQRPCVDVLPG